MATNNISFWELIDTNKVCIPIIQRDYAQGREEESGKRERFLGSIFKHIIKKEKLHLDFVYGRVKNQVFYPIDGQQRLTTLFLLHWYFAIKEKIDTEEKSKLIRFIYDTRISSREFCKALVEEYIEIPDKVGEDIFLKEIQKKYWFRASWTNDPTIKAMLVMIQAIHDKFFSIDTNTRTSVFQQLTKWKTITFEVLDLGEKDFELTDELYIKMNARGKQITAFENFKANFIQLIEKYFKEKKRNHPIKGAISYSGYFSYKIEKEWTDLFWAFRGDKQTTDEGFSNYFEFITQMLYFKNKKEAKAEDFKNTFSQYEELFSVEENLLFLFNSLDTLYKIFTKSGNGVKTNIDNFYEDLFLGESNQIVDISNIRLFWNKQEEFNLFEMLIKNNETEDISNKRRNWILLFCILQHLVKFEKFEVDEALKNYVRILRNLFQAARYKSDTKFVNDIRINYFGNYFPLFDKLNSNDSYNSIIKGEIPYKGSRFTESTIKNEIEKVKILQSNEFSINNALLSIENLEEFGSLIHQLKPEELNKNYPDYIQFIKEIWDDSIPSSLKIRALITFDFEGVYIKDCKMGEMWYFGKNNNWTSILTSEDSKVSASIIQLLNEYSKLEGNTDNKLNFIIKAWLNNNQNVRSWQHYFIKYPEFTSKLNYYVWPNDFEIRILGSEGSNPLVAFHISPFALTVCSQINNKEICDVDDCYLQYSGHSPLILKNGLTLTSIQQGWLIENNAVSLSTETIKKFRLKVKDVSFILEEIDNRDRIELAVDFINEIVKL